MKILLSGCTGFIGNALLNRLVQEKHEVILLTRNPAKLKSRINNSVHLEAWDGENAGPWITQLEGADAVVNLAGESIVGRRWTPDQKQKIIRSRIQSTQTLVSAMSKAFKKPSVLINASAIGYYGNVEEGEVTESHARGRGFLADTCERWESAALAAQDSGVRVVLCRTGIVLEQGGGALSKMIMPFKFFMGGHPGSGRQWFSWIHRDDEVGGIIFLLQKQNISGPLNLVSPEPVRMKEFCKQLGRVMRRPSWAPVPAFALKLMLGEMSEMLLTGQKVVPQKLLESGYSFRFPKLAGALQAIMTH